MTDSTDTSSQFLLSVVIPVYNGEATLRDCLSALSNQTIDRDKYDILVVDDGSTDSTPEIIAEFPVRCVRLEVNRGRVIARVTGVREAACDDIVLCDARVICEADVLEAVLACPRRPLMFGSDYPEEYEDSLYGRFLFGVYRRIWKPYFPQCWYQEEVPITLENFDKVPKGLGLFATDRDFFLRHQPQRTDRNVSDDTLLIASMVRETPVIRHAGLRAHYRQRNELSRALGHLHQRGMLFQSYYVRPRHRFFWYYIVLWLIAVAVVAVAVARPAWAWIIPAALAAVWAGSSALLGFGIKGFLATLAVLPLVGVCFGAGILRGQVTDLWNRFRGP